MIIFVFCSFNSHSHSIAFTHTLVDSKDLQTYCRKYLPSASFITFYPMRYFIMTLIPRGATEADLAAANSFRLYHYDPTVAGAVIFVLLFSATTAIHFWQLLKSRCWFLLPLAIGGICESREPGRQQLGIGIESS